MKLSDREKAIIDSLVNHQKHWQHRWQAGMSEANNQRMIEYQCDFAQERIDLLEKIQAENS